MEPIPLALINSFKKKLAQLYNQIEQEIIGLGTREQKIEIINNKIVIFSQNKRVPALTILGKNHPELTMSVDAALVSEFKARLKKQIETLFNLKVVTILKDYDPETESSCTVVYLEKSPLTEYQAIGE
jgi:uncharacterized protein YbcI